MQFTEQRKGKQKNEEFTILPQGTIPHNTHHMRDSWWNQGKSILHYQQEHFKNAVQEPQRIAYEEV